MILSECSLRTLKDIVHMPGKKAMVEFGISQYQLQHELDRRKRMADQMETILLDAESSIGAHGDYRRAVAHMVGWYIEIKSE